MQRILTVLFALALTSCGGSSGGHGGTTPRVRPDSTPPADPGDPEAFARAMNAFGLDVWEGLRTSGRGDDDLAISPASIATALAMPYAGARGQTAEAMQRALHLASGPEESAASVGALMRSWNEPRDAYELAVANRLFGDARYRFHPDYLAITRDRFGAELEVIDFRGAAESGRERINAWVLEQTHQRIPDLLPRGSVTADTRMVLVNAVYFHGRWQREFDRERTIDLPFFARGSEEVRVPTMSSSGGRYGEDDGVQILELPYRGGELAMTFVLPRDRGGLAPIEERLDAELVARWAGRVSERDVEIRIPRFRIETESVPLGPVLIALGMDVAFSDAADFSGMSEPGQVPLKVDAVFHRAFVELNEEGTEAAAATGVVMVEITSAGPRHEPPRFYADHPFLFFLRDTRSGAILFVGRVVDPR